MLIIRVRNGSNISGSDDNHITTWFGANSVLSATFWIQKCFVTVTNYELYRRLTYSRDVTE